MDRDELLARYSHGEREFRGVGLSNADLRGIELIGVDFSGATLGGNLTGSNLSGSRFVKATVSGDFSGATLERTNFSDATFAIATFSSANLKLANFENATFSRKTRFDEAILVEARFGRAFLAGTSFRKATLNSAGFHRAWLEGVQLSDADLSNAAFVGADLRSVNLASANLTSTDLRGAHIVSCNIAATVVARALLGYTTLDDLDLRGLREIDSVEHKGPSSVGIDTLYKSRGDISEIFMRGCGLPDELITYSRSLTQKPLDFYSCFISYSTKDQDFADRLFADLQRVGVRCWFAPENLKIGDRFPQKIEESIKVYDKLLLLLSENSVSSDWVEREVATATEKETVTKGDVLFPVRIDEAVMNSSAWWAGDLRRRRHIGDFTQWKQHDTYQKEFDRLLRDLKKSPT